MTAAPGHRAALAAQIPRRKAVAWWVGLVLALGFAALVVPSLTADRWLDPHVVAGEAAAWTVRVPPRVDGIVAGGGIVIARGEVADAEQARLAGDERVREGGLVPYAALFGVVFLLAAIFTHHMRRSKYGRLVRVQVASLAVVAVVAAAVKVLLLVTSASILVVPVAMFAIVPALVLDRVVGLATGILVALVVSLVGPFDLGVACLLLVQASVAGLVVPERPKQRVRAVVVGGGAAVACTAATYPLLALLTTGALPLGELADVMHSPWYAATLGPAIALVAAIALVPVYQRMVGEITSGQLTALTDLSHPLLKQIAEKAPGSWQHSLMMANLAEIAANAIGADGRLVRVGAYFHDLGKSLSPKYFIENLEPGETSPHDGLPPEVSCDAIFKHVTEGIVAARKAGLHERVVDFMHMHHGNGVLEYFWGKAREQGNPRGLTVEDFRYPGHPPQSRETAILAITDAVEAASRTLKKPDAAAIDGLVQRIVYGKLALGQLDESGLSASDLRNIAESLRETIKHANHGRIEYPWQKEAAAAAEAEAAAVTTTTAQQRALATSATAKAMRPATDGALAETADLRGMPPRDDDATTAPADVIGKRKSEPSLVVVEPRTRSREDVGGVVEPRTRSREDVGGVVEPRTRSRDDVGGVVEPRTRSREDVGPGAKPMYDDTTAPATPEAMKPVPATKPGIAPPKPAARESEREVANAIAAHVAAKTPSIPPATLSMPPVAIGASTPAAKTPSVPPATVAATPATLSMPPVALAAAVTADEPTLDTAVVVDRPPGDSRLSDLVAAAPAARKRAATLPPIAPRRAPTVPPTPIQVPLPSSTPARLKTRSSSATLPPGEPARRPFDEHAVTMPPANRAATPSGSPFGGSLPRPATNVDEWNDHPNVTTSAPAATTKMPASDPQDIATQDIATLDIPPEALEALASEAGRTLDRMPPMRLPPDEPPPRPSAYTDVTKPRIMMLPLVAPASNPGIALPTPWAAGLASRIDAAVADDEFGGETPIIAPTRADLQALLASGVQDQTRRQSVDEIEAQMLRDARAAAAEADNEPEFLRRRAPPQTSEVNPEDIEAIIEVAPAARRAQTSVGVAKKPKTPE